AFCQYAIAWGIARVGRLFKELDVPLSVVLNAEFPGRHGPVWKVAPIIAHGMNNTNRMLPLGRGLAAQKAYTREPWISSPAQPASGPPAGRLRASIPMATPCRRSSPRASTYTIDQMDSDIISRLKTPDGALVLLPYPVVTVDMGQHLARMKT